MADARRRWTAEKLLIEADLYTPPEPGAQPRPPSAGNRNLHDNLRRLGLDVETIVPIHGRPGPMSDFTRLMAESP